MLKSARHTDSGISADSLRRGIALLLMGAQLLGGSGILGHTHAFALRLVADPFLAAHECGEQEHHIPLDRIHPCVVCGQLYQRLSLPLDPADSSPVHSVTAGLCNPAVPPVVVRDHLFPEKRGPPAIV